MSNNNGAVELDWLDKTQIYAALSVIDDLQEASETLQEVGLEVSPQRLRHYQRNGNGRLQRMKQSGKAGQFLGKLGRHRERMKRVDRLTQWLEDQVMALGERDPEKLDKDRAMVLHRYREIMELLCQYDGASAENAEQQNAGRDTDADRQVQEGLSLLELISNGQPPDEVFDQLVSDATRRLAAASGTTFPPLEPY